MPASATEPRLSHCGQLAPSRRSATEIGVRPSVVDPTRMSVGRATTAARSTPLPVARAVDAQRRPGQRLEALLGDLLAAVRADPVGAVLDALQRGLDLPEDVLGVLLEGVVELAVVRLGRRVGEVVVVGGLLAGVVGQGAGRSRSWRF